MRRSLVEIYGLAVCFFAIACLVVVLGIAVWDVIAIAEPEFTISGYTYDQYQSDEAYKDRLLAEHRSATDKSSYAPPEGAELTQARERGLGRALASERRSAVQGLVRNVIILLVDVVVFLIHWRLAARVRRSAS